MNETDIIDQHYAPYLDNILQKMSPQLESILVTDKSGVTLAQGSTRIYYSIILIFFNLSAGESEYPSMTSVFSTATIQVWIEIER